MSFLAPLFFLGLGAIAVPILVHLIQRERKRVVEFPSLMFLRRIPVPVGAAPPDPPLVPAADARGGDRADRRRVRAAVLPAGRAAAAAAAGGDREVVILLDQSASMGYGDHWQRARDAARDAIGVDSAPTTGRRSCCSDATPKRTCARPPTAARLEAAIDAAKVDVRRARATARR